MAQNVRSAAHTPLTHASRSAYAGRMLKSAEVSIRESALLVIDAQDSFKASPRWERRNNVHFERNVGELIAAYRAAGLPVIFFLHTDPDPYFEAESPYLKLMDFIERRPDEPLFLKTTRNCFTSTGLWEVLLRYAVRRLVITGIQMEQCCETTARIAADLGFAVDFVTEATLTFPIANPHVPGRELSADDILERTEYALRGRFAQIATVADIMGELANIAA